MPTCTGCCAYAATDARIKKWITQLVCIYIRSFIRSGKKFARLPLLRLLAAGCSSTHDQRAELYRTREQLTEITSANREAPQPPPPPPVAAAQLVVGGGRKGKAEEEAKTDGDPLLMEFGTPCCVWRVQLQWWSGISHRSQSVRPAAAAGNKVYFRKAYVH